MWQTFSSYILNFLSGWFFMTCTLSVRWIDSSITWRITHCLRHFMPLVSSCTPWKYQQTNVLLMVDGRALAWNGLMVLWDFVDGTDQINFERTRPPALSQNQNLSLRFVFITLGISPGTSFKVEPSKEPQ